MQSRRISITVEHAPGPAGPAVGLAEQLAKIASLRDAGVLDETEFQAAKRKVLGA